LAFKLNKSVKFPLFVAITILLVSSCILSIGMPASATSTPDNWPMFNHDLAHTGYSTSTSPRTNQTLWTFTAGGAVQTSPAVVDGIVYFGSDDGYVYALNAANGSLIWKYNTFGPVQSSPAVNNGVVYIGGYHSHAVFALNAYTGALIWQAPTDSIYPNQISSVGVAYGLVYVDVAFTDVPSGGVLYAFNALTGNITWKYNAGLWTNASPAVYDGKVYIGDSGGSVIALDATSGNVTWKYGTLSDGNSPNSSDGTYSGSSSFLISNGLLYFGTWRLTVQAWDASTGAFRWSGKIEGSVAFSTPALANGVVYVSTGVGGTSDYLESGGVTAVNAKTGALLWNHTIGSISYSSPAIADGMVFVGSDIIHTSKPSLFEVTGGQSIYALNSADGATIWSYVTGGEVYSSPAVAYGVVYVGSNDGKVYAFGSSTGQIPLPAQPASPTATPAVPEFYPWIVLFATTATTLLLIGSKRKRRKLIA
jgi:eukaryotic-like serine/threonine-protein kinase